MSELLSSDFAKALQYGRPPNIVRLFPDSRALIVSGKYIDLAMRAKGRAMTLAANGRNQVIIRAVLSAAQKANAAVIIEIARSEGDYCPINFANIACQVDLLCNEMAITVPVAVHADHYTIKSEAEIRRAMIEIPRLFAAGMTSIALDASHLPDDQNLLTTLGLAPLIPAWSGLETEVGEIKGKLGLSTPEEALFLARGLNAHGIHPNWMALNNGTVHGIESGGAGIQIELTARIHQALSPYGIAGAQHGSSGNHLDRLQAIAAKTRTTKANVATALQMISWGVAVNEEGNALLDEGGRFAKIKGEGMAEDLWAEMTAYADKQGYKTGDYKRLNTVFDEKILAQPASILKRMEQRVEDFAFRLITEVFNGQDTAPIAIQAICRAASADPGPVAMRTEDPLQWTQEKICEMAKGFTGDKGPEGDFDD
jgi:fructose/tagatose bisphosphate aldolase